MLGSWLPHYACEITWRFSKLIRQISGKLLFDNCGKNVMMAPNVAIIATNHNIARTDIPMNLQGSVDKEIYIYIEDDV